MLALICECVCASFNMECVYVLALICECVYVLALMCECVYVLALIWNVCMC